MSVCRRHRRGTWVASTAWAAGVPALSPCRFDNRHLHPLLRSPEWSSTTCCLPAKRRADAAVVGISVAVHCDRWEPPRWVVADAERMSPWGPLCSHGSRSAIMVHHSKAARDTRAACVPASVMFRMLPKALITLPTIIEGAHSPRRCRCGARMHGAVCIRRSVQRSWSSCSQGIGTSFPPCRRRERSAA